MTYLERLADRVEVVRTSLCLGIDPHPDALPRGYAPNAQGVERFAILILESGLEHAAAVKINVAFFEALGSPGIAALERVRARIPSTVPFIADAKRGDIGSTAERQAVALFESLGADATTASPYLGADALEPLLERTDKFVYILCRTSNAGAAEIQDLDVSGEPLYVHVARRAHEWAAGRGNVGLVVGATAPDELRRVREAVPQLAFLVPGLGSQGGAADAVLDAGAAQAGDGASRRGGGLLVNVSRAIADQARDSDNPGVAISAAAADWALILRC